MKSFVRGVVIVLLAGACAVPDTAAPGGSTGIGAPPVEVTVFAAASLRPALDSARAAYEAANPSITLRVTTDSSAALAAQIQQGAPADVFVSADTTNPQELADGGYAEGEPVVFATNLLTIVVPADNPAGIRTWQDLAGPGLRIVAAGQEVPITKYATQLIGNLAGRSDAPGGFAHAYAANVVSREENVRALLAKVELGEGDAGIVYVSDAPASTNVGIVEIPAEANVPATYAGVVLKASHDLAAARAFLDWFAGPAGQAILAEHGFLPPPS